MKNIIEQILDENNHDYINAYDDFGNPIQWKQYVGS